jgi:serine/threonine-protein kinase 24/25/MST4
MNTMRPVKRVDAAGSLRLSNEYVGSIKSRSSGDSGEGNNENGLGESVISNSEAKTARKRAKSLGESAKAGRALVDEVVVPVLQRVRNPISLKSMIVIVRSIYTTIWMLMRSKV